MPKPWRPRGRQELQHAGHSDSQRAGSGPGRHTDGDQRCGWDADGRHVGERSRPAHAQSANTGGVCSHQPGRDQSDETIDGHQLPGQSPLLHFSWVHGAFRARYQREHHLPAGWRHGERFSCRGSQLRHRHRVQAGRQRTRFRADHNQRCQPRAGFAIRATFRLRRGGSHAPADPRRVWQRGGWKHQHSEERHCVEQPDRPPEFHLHYRCGALCDCSQHHDLQGWHARCVHKHLRRQPDVQPHGFGSNAGDRSQCQ